MKTLKVKPLAIVALSSFTLFSCASSDDSMDNATAMEGETTMSETQTMAGNAEDADAVIVTEEVVAPIATIPVAALSLKNSVEINEMFESIDNTENYTLIDLAKTSANLSTFVQLMETAGLTDDLKKDGEYTLFAPTNEAFSKLSQEDLEMLVLPQNKAKLSEILMVHILPSEVPSSRLNATQRITLNDDRYIPVNTALNGSQIVIGGATVVLNDVEASNGVIHVIDNVIIPSEDAVEGMR